MTSHSMKFCLAKNFQTFLLLYFSANSHKFFGQISNSLNFVEKLKEISLHFIYYFLIESTPKIKSVCQKKEKASILEIYMISI